MKELGGNECSAGSFLCINTDEDTGRSCGMTLGGVNSRTIRHKWVFIMRRLRTGVRRTVL